MSTSVPFCVVAIISKDPHKTLNPQGLKDSTAKVKFGKAGALSKSEKEIEEWKHEGLATPI
jgi:hypothetical protein